ncbi:hypothetical protein [Glycomyces tritici]|uniref:Glycosyltransferase n=1 Tax=Glycomyces tritici TaxID=2665176 RepID=A0ABT7YUH1_9ACTN|nr:hypothetical protein [Glycomyces tritici]MDN3241498.1 hypothetical protein [Glycomyces tritici]MDN3242285.1 hypothetical protein [Glycomyces tritici]
MRADIALSTAIMTHPAREDRARKLAESLPDLNPAVLVDDTEPGRGNLGNALRAWGAVGEDATHHLVLQDDVVPCDGFTALVRRAVGARPDAAISLFCEWGSRSATLARVAARRGWGWARAVDMYTPSQGLVMPRDTALAFAATEDAGGADDLALVAYLRGNGVENLVTVPNLLEHDDRLSLTANGFQGPRLAVCTAPAGADPDFGTPAAGTGLTRLPYASWMRVHAEWFYCGESPEAYTWLGEFGDTRLPEGFRKTDLAERFRADLAEVGAPLTQAASELTLFEYWTVHFALGLVQPEPLATPPGPFAEAAFATAFPGLFRRYLPLDTVDALRGSAGRLAAAAFERGAAADIERPQPAWYEETR